MADLVITAANVVAGTGVPTKTGVAGAAIAAGDIVYLDTATTGKWQLADSDAATAEARGQTGNIGIALNSAAANQPIVVQTEGPVTLGAVLTAGIAYYLSDTPGKLCPVADITGGDYYTLVGLAASTTVLNVDFQYSGVASP
ncbi:hypothetical protein ABID08_000712 [Rhizobium binae]|uniref:DUF2190 family protein n=1 Tax=Rhizobium binae TaxID=1138190 RepID=A0ABV2MDB3_9HYPH|nr:hypothetical protein [Rhizobium binae]MBX4992282.1 hypothetical protein [Rhizobium binae]NKL52420.1 hypothetical protein [Rhizobium leguminosarum bv. viciae]QSY80750.1 hypothetical protein J2J99_13600 [Rhizobium binae]